MYLLQVSGWLDCIPKPNTNPNPNKGIREMFRIEFLFKSYFEVGDDVWGDIICISEDCGGFVLANIFLRGW